MDRILAPLEAKFAADASTGEFEGYAAVFGNVDSYGDVIQKGAFKRTLGDYKKANRMPSMLSQHGGFFASDMMPIGVWTDMEEDSKGLYVKGKLADTPRGQEAYQLMKMAPRPALDGLSIGYLTRKFARGVKPEDPRRTLEDVELLEISLVTMPANPEARVQSVKAADRITTIREFEDFLRDVAGFSNAKAKAIASFGFKSVAEPRDEDGKDSDVAALAARFKALRGAV